LLPLGASGRSVRLNGIVYEGLIARLERRRAYELYHSALEVGVPDGRFVIEMTPVAGSDGAERDVVARGSCWYRLGGPVSTVSLRVSHERVMCASSSSFMGGA
jgi:hypothetical protein